MERVTDIRFVKTTSDEKHGEHIGFVDFTLDGDFAFKDMMVFKNGRYFKVIYRKHPTSDRYYVHPINAKTSLLINKAVTTHLKENGYGV